MPLDIMPLESLQAAANKLCRRISDVYPEQSSLHYEVQAECRTLLAEVAEAQAFVKTLAQRDHSPTSEARALSPPRSRQENNTTDFFMYSVPQNYLTGGLRHDEGGIGPAARRMQLPEVSTESYYRSSSDWGSTTPYYDTGGNNTPMRASHLNASVRARGPPERLRGEGGRPEEASPGLKVLGLEIEQDEAFLADIPFDNSPSASQTLPQPHSPSAANAVDQPSPANPLPRRTRPNPVLQPPTLASLSPIEGRTPHTGAPALQLPEVDGLHLPDVASTTHDS